MFIILLKLADKAGVSQHMAEHKRWLENGLEHGHFMLAGTLGEGLGGGILAKAKSKSDIERLINQDPFVQHGVAIPQIIEFTPSMASDELKNLLGV